MAAGGLGYVGRRDALKFQREGAERILRNIEGVSGTFNLITLKPQASVGEVRDKVRSALQRQATADANNFTLKRQAAKLR